MTVSFNTGYKSCKLFPRCGPHSTGSARPAAAAAAVASEIRSKSSSSSSSLAACWWPSRTPRHPPSSNKNLNRPQTSFLMREAKICFLHHFRFFYQLVSFPLELSRLIPMHHVLGFLYLVIVLSSTHAPTFFLLFCCCGTMDVIQFGICFYLICILIFHLIKL